MCSSIHLGGLKRLFALLSQGDKEEESSGRQCGLTEIAYNLMTTKTVKRLGIIGDYPSVAAPVRNTFVRQLAHAFSRAGVTCTVLSPVNLWQSLNREGYPYHSIESVPDGTEVHVFRPRFINYWGRGNFAKLGILNPRRATLHSVVNSVMKTIRCEKLEFDAIYGHFFYSCGVAAIQVGRQFGIPAFPGMGESTNSDGDIWSIRPYGIPHAKRQAKDAAGIITNSSLLAHLVSKKLDYPSEKVGVFPNGTNLELFRPSDRCVSRKEFGFPEDGLIVACVGHFSHRKGQQRVLDAIAPLEGVKVAFIGNNMPFKKDNNVLWNTALPQEKIPRLLSACDILVLPTLREGSCNVIVESMACGLPVISSEGAFNDDLLTEQMSIRVDPMDVAAIRKAIAMLRDDSMQRKQMAAAARERSKLFDINQRAQNILNFMQQMLSLPKC